MPKIRYTTSDQFFARRNGHKTGTDAGCWHRSPCFATAGANGSRQHGDNANFQTAAAVGSLQRIASGAVPSRPNGQGRIARLSYAAKPGIDEL